MSDPSLVPRYAVLGNPVAHSRSPFIHEAFAQQCGLPMRYERVLSPLDAFEATVRRFAAEGGRGANITMPFKFQVPALAARCSARAVLAGAANVLRFDADGWSADNTDGIGLVRDIQQGAGVALAGRRVLLLGAGGAGAGALGPLVQARPARVVVANRSFDKAKDLVARHAAWAGQHGVSLQAADLGLEGTFDIVVNATSSSVQGAGVPVPARLLAPGALALDMMYGAAALPFLRWAQAAGATARDGLGMLVEQAAEAFFIFRGVMPAAAPVLAALRAQLDAEVGRQVT
ncbi:MAG: shikimate dehydrogenase [Rubrivivax sp.]|nr:shikimate dehydrogenase [Rubrivivax sp.]